MTELIISEITDGIGSTGVRPGIIKVGTGTGASDADIDRLTNTNPRAFFDSRPLPQLS